MKNKTLVLFLCGVASVIGINGAERNCESNFVRYTVIHSLHQLFLDVQICADGRVVELPSTLSRGTIFKKAIGLKEMQEVLSELEEIHFMKLAQSNVWSSFVVTAGINIHTNQGGFSATWMHGEEMVGQTHMSLYQISQAIGGVTNTITLPTVHTASPAPPGGKPPEPARTEADRISDVAQMIQRHIKRSRAKEPADAKIVPTATGSSHE